MSHTNINGGGWGGGNLVSGACMPHAQGLPHNYIGINFRVILESGQNYKQIYTIVMWKGWAKCPR